MVAEFEEILLLLGRCALKSYKHLILPKSVLSRASMLQGWNKPDRHTVNGIISIITTCGIDHIIPIACAGEVVNRTYLTIRNIGIYKIMNKNIPICGPATSK